MTICLLLLLTLSNSWWGRRRRRRRRSCSSVNCQVGGWTSWSSCSHQCGTSGTQARTRQQMQAQVYFFQGFLSNMLCLCHYGPALLGFWFQTDLGTSYHGHALVTLYVQFLYSDWSKFDRWVHVEKLCILKVVYFDSWSWQSFVSTCDVFKRLFPLVVQK